MKLTSIIIVTLVGASKATDIDIDQHTDGDAVPRDVAASDLNEPGLASVLAAVFSSATPNLRGVESFAVSNLPKWHPTYTDDNGDPVFWNDGYCRFVVDANSPDYPSKKACCEGSYGGQASGFCLSRQTRAPTLSPINAPTNAPTSVPTSATIRAPTIIRFVNCINGMAYDPANPTASLGKTCEAECNGACCKGIDACDEFTGKVAKDGSCMGDYACFKAGSGRGSVGLISGASCDGNGACKYIAHGGGVVGDISEASCVGERACRCLGDFGGKIGDLSGCCKGKEMCHDM